MDNNFNTEIKKIQTEEFTFYCRYHKTESGINFDVSLKNYIMYYLTKKVKTVRTAYKNIII